MLLHLMTYDSKKCYFILWHVTVKKNVTSFNDLWQLKMWLQLMTCDSKNVTPFNNLWQQKCYFI